MKKIETSFKPQTMKNLLRSAAIVTCQLMFTHFVCAQGTATTSAEVPKVEAGFATKPTVVFPTGKAVTITIKNDSELPVNIFAGPREELKNPRVQPIGGISTDKLYLKENEVICLLSTDRKPKACTVIKPGATSAEINSTGTNISSQ